MTDRRKIEKYMNNASIPQYKPEVIKAMIVEEATKQGVPVELALAVAQQESGFNNKAVSKPNTNGSRDHGVFQLNDKYHKLNNVYDPVENIRYGIGMLKAGLRRNNGDVARTLSDYNAGPNATGAGRRQGDSYAQKVIAIAKGINPQSGITGAAAPVPQSGAQQATQSQDLGDAMAELSQGALTQGEKIVEKYIKDAGYDTKLYKEIKDNKQKEIKEALDEIKSLPTTASAEELQAITNQYAQAKQDLNQAYSTAIAGIQSGMGPQKVNDYYKILEEADRARINEMRSLNPYTQMGKVAPLNIDEDAYVKAAQLNNYAQANANALNPQSFVPRDFQAEQMRVAQARQLAQGARQTGLTPEQMIEGGLLDYKNTGTILNNQQQAMIQLIAAAQQGDRQAQQVLANMQVNQAINNNALTQNAITAQQAANAAALDRARFAAENARWGVQQGQNLDMYPITSDASIQAEKLQQTGNIMNSAANRGVNAAGNMLNYQAMLQKAATGGDASDDLKTFLSINNPELQAASQSPQVDALPNAIAARKEAIARNFPQYAGYVYPNAPTNSYVPITGLTGFNVSGQNTFRPQQQ